MPLSISAFKGMVPRIASHLLPNNCAQYAVNTKLLNGNIVPLTNVQETDPKTFGGPWKSIFFLANQYWLRWPAIVTVARSSILDDTTNRIYYTFDDGSGPPMVTNLQLATGTTNDVTTDSFVISAIGTSQDIPVNNYGFVIGESVTVDGLTGSVTGTVLSKTDTNTAAGWKQIQLLVTATADVGVTVPAGATVIAATTRTDYPLLSFKLGVPAPLNAPSVNYDYSELTVSYLDPCSILTTAAITDATTANFTIVVAGTTQVVSVGNGSQFAIHEIVNVADGTNSITGSITAISGNDLTVQTIEIISGLAGNVMAVGAPVTVSAYTTFPTGANGSVTLDTSVGNPADSFKLLNTGVDELPIYIYKDFAAGDLPVSELQFDFLITYTGTGLNFGMLFNAIVGATSGGSGNIAGISTATPTLTSTTATFTLVAVGTPVTFPVISVAGISVGQSIIVDDGAFPLHAIQALVTGIAGLNVTATTQKLLAGGIGNTMANPAKVGFPNTSVSMFPQTLWTGFVAPAGPAPLFNMVYNTFYCMQVFYLGEMADGFLYRVRILDSTRTTVLFNQTFTQAQGPQGTFMGWNVTPLQNILVSANIDNLGAQDFIADGAAKDTTYVFTYVNQLGMESAPSPISNLFITADGLTKIVTLPPIPGAGEFNEYGFGFLVDYGIIGRRLYRSATSANGTSELLVVDEAVLNLGTNTYVDNLTDAQLGVPLPSDGWELPPVDGKSIISLPNGLTALISNNQICISPVGIAHAFPENSEGAATYRYPTDTPGVALGNIDSTLIALTEGYPYIASGVDPTSFSMGKLEKSYGCVNGRSSAYLRQYGVIYASTTGLMCIAGAGLRNMTQAYFTQDDWDFVNPASIVATVRDDRYFGFCQPIDGTIRGFVFDPKEEGQAWSWFDLSPNLDWDQVPADGYYTDDTTGVTYMIQQFTLNIFDATAGTLSPQYLTQLWKSKIFRQAFSTTMNYACVKPGLGYNPAVAPITFDQIVDGITISETVVPNREAFTIGSYPGEDIVVQVKGAWPVTQIDEAEDVELLT